MTVGDEVNTSEISRDGGWFVRLRLDADMRAHAGGVPPRRIVGSDRERAPQASLRRSRKEAAHFGFRSGRTAMR